MAPAAKLKRKHSSSSPSGPSKSLKLSNIPEAPSGRHKIIVGIDYGTTFSGVSYVTSDKSDIADINIIKSWPGDQYASWKTPTRIAYARENPKIQTDKWGFEVDSKLHSYSWTKLLLDQNAQAGDHDDPALSRMAGPGMLQLPAFRNAQGVCEDFLREVYKHVSTKLRQELTDLIFQTTPMECWITLPAIWSDEAKDSTLKAAKNAGFGNKRGDEVFTITEPEAAAIATLGQYATPGNLNSLEIGENILVCDCGGGTVDITTYTITRVSPTLEFDELCVGVGGKCGSSYIDRNLHALLSQRFGPTFNDLPNAQKGPGSKFMASFEAHKRDFGLSGDDDDGDIREIGPIRLDAEDSKYYDEEERMVKLTYKDMRFVFEPVIAEILSLVGQQVKEARKDKKANIDRIILVGGFAESAYLYKALEDWCTRNGRITLIRAPHPQSAVVRGAALRGLDGIAPRMKHVRRHYGICINMDFREGVDPPNLATYDRFEPTRKMCQKRMEWLISKGDEVVQGTRKTVDLRREYEPRRVNSFSMDLYSCSLADAPEYLGSERIEKVGVVHSYFAPDFNYGSATQSNYNANLRETIYKFPFQVAVVFGNKGTNLVFENVVDGKVASTAEIKFDQR